MTDKSKSYTPQFQEITNKYGLDLKGAWNKEVLPHQGRHPNAYHDFMLDNVRQFDNIANGDKDLFLDLFNGLKQTVNNNPEMLYKNYWRP